MLIAEWKRFFGAIRKVTPRRLQDGIGEDAQNMRRGSRDLRPLLGATTVVSPPPPPAPPPPP